MPGYLLHLGATVLCMHGGQAQPTSPNPRVKVGGQPVTTQPIPYVIAGCALPPPPIANGPCVTGTWIIAAMRVKVEGMPVLLRDSVAVCVPTGTGLNVVMTQVRVKGM
jgi:hypothetical protein